MSYPVRCEHKFVHDIEKTMKRDQDYGVTTATDAMDMAGRPAGSGEASRVPRLGATIRRLRMAKGLTLLKDTAKLSPVAALGKGLAMAAGTTADAVTADGSLNVLRYGHVLKSRQLVGVRGAGLAFDGLYYVKRVDSTLKAGEFKQQFSLARNGLISTLPLVPP